MKGPRDATRQFRTCLDKLSSEQEVDDGQVLAREVELIGKENEDSQKRPGGILMMAAYTEKSVMK